MGITGNRVKRALATSVAVAWGGWAVLMSPATADPGNGNSAENAAPHSAASQTQDNGNGPKNGPDNGKDPQGPKDPKDPQGPKGNGQGQGNQGGSGGVNGVGGGANGDPAGNNGTVKITPHLEDDGIPQNTPHVSCVFDIEWYGFDEGPDIISTVEFAMQAPTAEVGLSGTEPSQVFVGGDPASGAGTDSGFDGEATYTLAFDGEPHPQQGYHVKLTVHTPGSQGADTKHKVFWVQPCTGGGPTATEETSAEQSSSVEGSEVQVAVDQAAGEQQFSTEAGVMGTHATADHGTAGTEAAAVDAAAADVPTQVAAGTEGSLFRDVAGSPWALMAIALGLLSVGAALVARRRTS